MMLAADSGFSDTVQLLLSAGAAVDTYNVDVHAEV